MTEFQTPQIIGKSRQPFKNLPAPQEPQTELQDGAGAKDTAQPSPEPPMQVNAGAKDTPSPQELKDCTLSVDDISKRFQQNGFSKSDDTIQRYCREGRLIATKKGIMRNWYATPKSVDKLIDFLREDAPERNRKQVHAGALKQTEAENKDPHAGASTRVQTDKGSTETGQTNGEEQPTEADKSDQQPAINSSLERELRTQISDKNKTINFLQEELKDRRTQTKALEKVIDAFKDNAETARLKAELETEREAKQGNKDKNNAVKATVVSTPVDGGEVGDNQTENSQPNSV